MSDTIYALSTSPGRAAIAVIRVSGPAASTVITRLTGSTMAARRAYMRTLRHPTTGEALDQALVLYFQAPASETGEDLAELQVHGSRAIIHAVLAAIAVIDGCRPAEPGEFAHRAFVNGKMDLTAAEGLADLIDAETDAQRRQALAVAAGQNAELYESWRTLLVESQALTESAIDFSDEGDVSLGAAAAARDRASALFDDISSHLAGASRAEIIRDGFHVVIAGPPNAGKSTLLNALARRDAAIVSDEPGTTRDLIDVHLDLASLAVMITDTAGIRTTDAAIESEGIRRAYARARSADLVIWLTDATDPVPPPSDLAPPTTPILDIHNKVDLLPSPPPNGLSASTGAGLDALTAEIVRHATDRLGESTQLVPISARQTFHLTDAVQHLRNYLDSPADAVELRAEDLRLAAIALGRLTGRIDAEDILDQIFSRFCIGK